MQLAVFTSSTADTYKEKGGQWEEVSSTAASKPDIDLSRGESMDNHYLAEGVSITEVYKQRPSDRVFKNLEYGQPLSRRGC